MEHTQDVSLEEIVFSCNVCQATVSDVHSRAMNVQRIRSEDGFRNGLMVKLWILECSHVTCAQHLEGGAVPFHPKDQQPQASCPICVTEHHDHTKRKLYSIYGLRRGEYDEHIPEVWMKCPPVRIEDHAPEMEAMRFQYSSIVRYARGVTKHLRTVHDEQRVLEKSFLEEHELIDALRKKVLGLKSTVAELRKKEVKLQKWESRKPSINHYLRVVTEMSYDIQLMRWTLVGLGYNVPERKYAFDPNISHPPARDAAVDRKPSQQAVLSTGDDLLQQHGSSSSSSRKRKRQEQIDSSLPVHSQDVRAYDDQRQSSRDLMPPPLGKVRPTASSQRLSSATSYSREAHSHDPSLTHRSRIYKAPSSTRYVSRNPGRERSRDASSRLSFRPFRDAVLSSRHSKQNNETWRPSLDQHVNVITSDDTTNTLQRAVVINPRATRSPDPLEMLSRSAASCQTPYRASKYLVPSSTHHRPIPKGGHPNVPGDHHNRQDTELNDWFSRPAKANSEAVYIDTDAQEYRRSIDDSKSRLPYRPPETPLTSPFFTRNRDSNHSYISRPIDTAHRLPLRTSVGRNTYLDSRGDPGRSIQRENDNQRFIGPTSAYTLPPSRYDGLMLQTPILRADVNQARPHQASQQEARRIQSLRDHADCSPKARTGRLTLPVSLGLGSANPIGTQHRLLSTFPGVKGVQPFVGNTRFPLTPLRGGSLRSTFSSAGRRSVQR